MVRQIVLLDSLVPVYPLPGAPARRNHEYPYQDTAGNWRAPCDVTAFTEGEMKRIRSCTGKLMNRLPKILAALNLLYP